MSLKEKAVKGVKWASIATGWCTFIQWAQLVIVTRLLKPEDFGLLAMAMIVIGFAQLVGDLGISAAIIQKKEITRKQLSSTYWLNVFFGIILFGLVSTTSPLVAAFFKETQLIKIIVFVSVTFVLSPWGAQFQLLFQKDLKFNILAKKDMIVATVQFLVTVAAAYSGLKVYSLIVGQYASLIVNVAILFKLSPAEWRPMLRFKLKDIKGFISFGMYQLGERAVNYFNMQFDRLIIGKFLGSMQVGYYNVAMNFVMQPINKINPMLTNVAFPVFSKVQDQNGKLQSGYTRMLKIVSTINSPLLIGFAAVSMNAVPVIFGEQWRSSVQIFQLLSIYSLFRSLCNPSGSLILAKGRVDLGFKWNITLFFLSPLVTFIGFKIYGIIGIAVALVIWQVLQLFGIYVYMIKRLVGGCLLSYVDGVFRPILMSSVMGFIVWNLANKLEGTITNIIIEVLVGGTVYAVLYFVFDRGMVEQLRAIVLKEIHKNDK